ncbi:TPA: transcription termination/antitermination NusG family protein [Serratia marcescens]
MKAWYLLCCQENTWRRTLKALDDAGVEVCCPLSNETRARTDKKNAVRHVQYPVFPGYIFTRFDPADIHTTTIIKMPGARLFVRFGKEISVIPDNVIAAMRCAQFELLKVGFDSFKCRNAPPLLLNKMQEIYTTKDRHERVSALMSLLSLPFSLWKESA